MGRPPLQNAPDMGAAQTQVSAALPRAPHRLPPPAQRPGLFQPGGVRASLGPRLSSGVAATGRRLRTPGRGPKAVVERWAPRALTPLSARRPWTARGSLCFCGRHLDPVATGSRVRDREVQPRSPMLGPRGARRAQWVGRCEELSEPGMRAGNGGTQLGDPVRGPPAAVVLTGLCALS